MTYTNIDSSSSSSAESISVIEELQASTSSSSASSPVDPPPVNPQGKQALSCAICGGVTSCRHFGAVSCNACAAFFRRTIAEKRTYSCSHHGNCTLISELVRRMCRHCRFKKCLQVGMQESEVLSLGSAGKQKSQIKDGKIKQEVHDVSYFSGGEADNFMDERKPVVGRFDHGGRYYSSDENNIIHRLKVSADQILYNRAKFLKFGDLDSNSVSSFPTTCMNVLSEVQVFHTFLKSSGLTDYIDTSRIYDNILSLTQVWNSLQMFINTLHLDGHSVNRLYFIDHTYMPVTDGSFTEWYASDDTLRKDPHTITRLSMPMWSRCLEVVRHLKDAEFTPVEEAVFITLIMANSIIDICGDSLKTKNQLSPFTNEIFKSMKRYYMETMPSEDYGYRMGRIVMLLSLCNDVNRMMNDHREHIILLGQKMNDYFTNMSLNKAIEHLKVDEISKNIAE